MAPPQVRGVDVLYLMADELERVQGLSTPLVESLHHLLYDIGFDDSTFSILITGIADLLSFLKFLKWTMLSLMN